MLLALFHTPLATWSIGEFAIAVVMACAVIALVWIALKRFKITIPDWVLECFWVLVVAFVIIFAIRLVLSM